MFLRFLHNEAIELFVSPYFFCSSLAETEENDPE